MCAKSNYGETNLYRTMILLFLKKIFSFICIATWGSLCLNEKNGLAVLIVLGTLIAKNI